MGFKPVARHRHKNVLLYRQGTINFLINAEPDSFAQRFARLHGPSVCAIAFRCARRQGRLRARRVARRMGLRLRQAGRAEHPRHQGHWRQPDLLRRPLARQGRCFGPATLATSASLMSISRGLPGIGAGGPAPFGPGLTYIDHLTHNVHQGRMGEWADFYERLFNFREIRYFDIEGQVTGVKSKGHDQPCGKIRIPINEEGKKRARSRNTWTCTRARASAHRHGFRTTCTRQLTACASNVRLLDTIDTYYELVDKRIPGPRRAARRAAQTQRSPDRRQEGRPAAADLQREPARPDLLRVHPAQRAAAALATATSRPCSRHRVRPDPPRRYSGTAINQHP